MSMDKTCLKFKDSQLLKLKSMFQIRYQNVFFKAAALVYLEPPSPRCVIYNMN